MKRSIVFKLFLAITLVFCLFITIITVAQTLFLEQFYVKKKVDVIEEDLEKFVDSYEGKSWNQEKLNNTIHDFYERNNAYLGVLNMDGNPPYIKSYLSQFGIVIRDANNKEISIPLTSILYSEDPPNIEALQLKEGNDVTVSGSLTNSIFMPISITTNVGKWEAKLNKPPSNLIVLQGKIIKVMMPTPESITLSSKWFMFQRGIGKWIEDMKSKKIPVEKATYEYIDSKTGIKNKISVQPIEHGNNGTEIAFAMTSLQPVDEAVGVVKTFYWYAFFLSLLLIVFISFYFSKVITHPLIKMNRVTRKMAALDFSEKIKTNSNDEIGSLSMSINTLSDNLKEKIDELQVANKQLQKDIEKERKLENTRREFISGVSHELKTPLSVIRSYTEGVKDNISKERTEYYTEVILEEIEKMDTLIVDMLELAKLESGTYHVHTETFSIVGLLDDVYHKLLFVLQEKNMDIEFIADDDYEVVADRRRIEQVMTNFITNAVRYGNEDSDIIIRLTREETEVKMEVENDGSTIPEELMGKVWERFYRVDDSRNRHKGGTGLGLSIVRNILDLHNAPFGVENIENGVKFYFSLPIYQEEEKID
jgi:signal transduction histidine kinase